ncbi:MAG: hypothetical protein HY704_10465 [Gemmatimonadetes bacterium]|nr:hypothetical protein [Gemmatimonadota bacterium]
MRRGLIAVSVLLVLLLDWAALDDITTGNEPGYALEYLMVVVSLPLLGLLWWLWWRSAA